MDQLFTAAINDGLIKGCALLVGDATKIFYKKSFGDVKEDSIFELGTFTQAIFTATATMMLTAEKHLNLNAPAGKYIHVFAEEGKEKITLKQLLKHTSGLARTKAYLKEGLSREQILEKVCYEDLVSPPAFEQHYSELGFIVLGAVIEAISGLTLNEFLAEKFVKPFSLTGTSFQENVPILGHTGLKSTIEDCYKIIAYIANCYSEKDSSVPKQVVDEFVGVKARYKLGWEKEEATPRTIKIISDTGCAAWFDLEKGLILELFTHGGSRDSLEKWFPMVYAELTKSPV